MRGLDVESLRHPVRTERQFMGEVSDIVLEGHFGLIVLLMQRIVIHDPTPVGRTTMRTVVSVSLPPDLATELSRLARKTGRTKSDILKESFSAHLRETKFQALQRHFRPRAKKAGILTEGDVFRLVS